jgi:hypothetical protein
MVTVEENEGRGEGFTEVRDVKNLEVFRFAHSLVS